MKIGWGECKVDKVKRIKKQKKTSGYNMEVLVESTKCMKYLDERREEIKWRVWRSSSMTAFKRIRGPITRYTQEG